MTPRNVEDLYPLSPMQQGMLFQCQNQPDAGLYIEQLRLSLDGLEPGAFRAAWQHVAEHQASLRTSIVGTGLAEPAQVVRREVEVPWEELDWRSLDPEDQQQKLSAFLPTDEQRGFPLSDPSLVRFTLIRTGRQRFEFVWTLHHIVLDGWSASLVLQDALACYAELRRGDPPSLPERRPFRDYIRWLRDQDLSRAEAYWRRALEGYEAPVGLGAGDVGQPVEVYDEQEIRLSAATTDALRRCATDNDLTLNTLVQGAWALLLGKYSGERDLVFGTVVSGRPEALDGVDSMVGMFVNTLPFRVQLPANRSVTDWLREIQQQQVEQRRYQYSPLWLVQQWSDVPAGTPLFESLFVFENYGVQRSEHQLDGLTVRVFPPFDRTGHPLMLLAMPGERIVLRITHDANRFESETIARWLRELEHSLQDIVDYPDRSLSRHWTLSDDERQLVLHTWNRTETDYPAGRCLHDLFEEQAAAVPRGVAVVCGDEELTYRELDERANQLAHSLQQLGVGPDTTVGVCVERSIEMVVAVLAVLKAGGAYLPLDPGYPPDRLATMAADARVRVVISHTPTRDCTPGTADVLCLDSDADRIAACPTDRPPSEVRPSGLAYVLYTSGSTGRPKGVAMPHAPLVNLMHWQIGESACGAGTRTLQFAPLSFDVSCQEIFATLGIGGTLCLVRDEVRRDPHALLSFLRDRSVARVFLPFVALQQLAEAALQGDAVPAALREVITAGEQLQVNATLVEFFRRLPDCALVNQYGPTECHVVSSLSLVGAPETWPGLPPIGRPIANVHLYILDAQMQPVAIGVPGELYIGGAAVSRGYLGDNELERRAFVRNPFGGQPDARLYRTGDLARSQSDGNIEFLGRADSQVKLRGFRVELGEVESVLLDHPHVQQAVAVVREDRPGDRRLVAYVVTEDAKSVSPNDLRAFLSRRLPDYMLPSGFVDLKTLPLTPSGKVDRRALLSTAHAPLESRASYVAPRDAVEQSLAEAWSDVLGVRSPGVHDDFFELGGHSLMATQLVSRIRDILQIELPQRRLFEHRTIARLGAVIRDGARGRDEAARLVAVPRVGELPLSFAQYRLWFLDQMGSGAAYNMPWAFHLEGELDFDVLQRSLAAIVQRHEALRTRFPAVDGKPIQEIQPAVELHLGRVDLIGLDAAARETEVERIAEEEAERPFDLAAGPVLRPLVVRLGERDHVLFLSIHHIAFDGWSIGVLNRELHAFYRAFSTGEEPSLPELPIQYADFSRWQNDWMRGQVLDEQLSYWRAQLDGLPTLQVPTDRPRPTVQTYLGAAVPVVLSPELTRALKLLSRREGVTLAMTLLAAFKTLLARYTGQDDIVVGSPIANRTRSELEDLIGFFVNALVLRSDLSGDPGFRDLLHRTQKTALSAYEHQDLPFERLVDELQPERDQSKNPLFQVVFAMQNTPGASLELPQLRIRPFQSKTRMTRFDLELHLSETESGVAGGFCYNVALFERATIERMVARFVLLLEGVVADPDVRLSQVPLLAPPERRQLMEEWNDTKISYPVDSCLHAQFETQAERTPDAIAVVCGSESLTYRQLNQNANQLAHTLRSRGLQPDELVGLCLERGNDLVVAILGILKAGGGYVPLDLANPKDRIAFILDDTGVGLLVAESSQLEKLPEHDAECLCLDRDRAQIEAQSTDNPEPRALPHNAAYVIYTSGSTGTPKGVVVEHRTVARLFPATEQWYQFGADDVWTLFHSCAFDFSVWEMWGALLYGGRLVVVPYLISRSPDEFYELLVREGVTVLNQTPSAFRQLMAVDRERGGDNKLELRWVIFGGEALDLQSLRPWFSRHGDERPRLVNMYGITETTVHVTYRPLSESDLDSAPGSVIGVPIPDLQVYVLDAHMQPVPIGIPGELYVGGAGVARGYLRRPELTDQRFVADPFRPEPGARLYRTGDLARYLPNRDIEYLGRNDEQVKIRGFRIELGEIEAALNALPLIRDAVATSQDTDDGTRRLVAYVVPEHGGANSEEAEVVDQWESLYDRTYEPPPAEADPTFNISGWNSSYTSEPIPAAEMREWVEETVDRVLRCRPRRVLEIGCGTGLLLFRIAPACTEYVGTDFSQVAVDYVTRHLGDEVSGKVTALRRRADDFGGFEPGSFDVVLLNSVVQYFPSISYLLRVLEGAVDLLAPGGRVLLGDVRNLCLLEEYHTSVEVYRAAQGTPTDELRSLVQQRVAQEEELVIDPAFFLALTHHLPRLTHVEIEPKRGRARNELTGFRYEVSLHVEADRSPSADILWFDWRDEGLTLDEIRAQLVANPQRRLGIRRIPNDRTLADSELARAVIHGSGEGTVDELRDATRATVDGRGVDPAALCALADDLPCRVALSWARTSASGEFDALFAPEPEDSGACFPMPSVSLEPWAAYANQPLLARMTRQLAPTLRESLAKTLPDYMVPAAFVMLESLPLTANGKVDRRALPEPDWYLSQRKGTYLAPRTPTERGIAEIWCELLGAEQVGAEDDFFDLGGHSLLATQVVSRVCDEFEVELELRQLFEAPTVAELAEVVDGLRWAQGGWSEQQPAAIREKGEL